MNVENQMLCINNSYSYYIKTLLRVSNYTPSNVSPWGQFPNYNPSYEMVSRSRASFNKLDTKSSRTLTQRAKEHKKIREAESYVDQKAAAEKAYLGFSRLLEGKTGGFKKTLAIFRFKNAFSYPLDLLCSCSRSVQPPF